MISLRCKLIVKTELENIGLRCLVVELGIVEVLDDMTHKQHAHLKKNLIKFGLELMDEKSSLVVENIINVINDMIYNSKDFPKLNFSEYLSDKLQLDYSTLSNIFSEVKCSTIQQFIVLNKIERVKELLLYDQLNFKEIAEKLDYRNVAHLSKQFKKVTGLSLSFFKQLKQKRLVAVKPANPPL